jgi:hypothetical protein
VGVNVLLGEVQAIIEARRKEDQKKEMMTILVVRK